MEWSSLEFLVGSRDSLGSLAGRKSGRHAYNAYCPGGYYFMEVTRYRIKIVNTQRREPSF